MARSPLFFVLTVAGNLRPATRERVEGGGLAWSINSGERWRWVNRVEGARLPADALQHESKGFSDRAVPSIVAEGVTARPLNNFNILFPGRNFACELVRVAAGGISSFT